jgi:hypothetical protein
MRETAPDPFHSDDVVGAPAATGRFYGGADRFDPLDTPVPGFLLGTVIAVVVAGIDFCTFTFNMSIIYTVPMAMCARGMRRPAQLWAVAAALTLLAYGGYFGGPWDPQMPTWHDMLTSYRVWNRSVSVVSVIAIAAISHYEFSFRRRTGRYRAEAWRIQDADRDVFVDVIRSFDQFRAGAMILLIVGCVAFADLIGPAALNTAIAYSVPVLISARAESRRLVWLTVLLTLALTWLGYVSNRPVDPVTHLVLVSAWKNRAITAAVIVLMGSLVHVWVGSNRPRTDRRQRQQHGGGAGEGATAPTTEAKP